MNTINFNSFPNLSTPRLILRRISPDDAVDLFPLRADWNVMQYISRPLAKSVGDAKKLISIIDDSLIKNEGVTWAITLKSDDRLIGTIGYWKIVKEHHRAEIGYLLAPACQGKGIMHEALEKVLAYGFEVLKLHSVEAVVAPLNTSSIKLLERNGFIKEAHFKENFYFGGRFHDSAVYSLLTTKL
ncbi:MAG: GNAT family N-acetyltransferase [Bacteroidota bacterium]|nr:GNAT family N-acetyltransferase [Bacteroidota bacterium]